MVIQTRILIVWRCLCDRKPGLDDVHDELSDSFAGVDGGLVL
jgi:hypothetical protein